MAWAGWVISLRMARERPATLPEDERMSQFRDESPSVTLRSEQQEDGTWVCEYTISKFGFTGLTHITGHPTGIFFTQDEAEAAALESALAEINAWGAGDGLINGSVPM